MKPQDHKIKTMDINEAGRIVTKAHKEEGENWSDYWNPIGEDLRFTSSSMDVLIGYCMNGDGGGFLDPLLPVLSDLKDRIDRAEKKLDEAIHKLGEKHRLGPYMPMSKEKGIFTLPKVVIEKYRLV